MDKLTNYRINARLRRSPSGELAALSRRSLEDLKKATRYGGAEFLSLILEAAEEITGRTQAHLLADPIDPSTV